MRGEDFFMFHMTRGPAMQIPSDLRILIRKFTFPRVIHQCTRCGSGVIVRTISADTVTECDCFVDDDRRLVCSSCVNPNEALIGQTPRRGWPRGAHWR